MELVPNDDSYNYRYLEVAHQTGYCQLYELNDRVSVELVQNAAKQLKLRWAEAWATLMRGEEITLGNSIFRLQK
jgi:hypothetical protein